MVSQMTEEQMYEEATKRVKERKPFYGSLATYLIVSAVLVVIWALSGQGYPWFLWTLGIWGVFVFGKGSDRQAIEKEVEKMKRGQP